MRGHQSNRRKWRIMLRRVSRWGVTALGVVLAVCGVAAMVGRLGHHPGRTGVEPVYRRRDGLGRRGRRDRLGPGSCPARRNTRGGAVAARRGKIARAFRPRRQAATERGGATLETAAATSAPGANANAAARANAARSASAARGRPVRPAASSGEGAGARSRGARGRGGERRRASRSRPIRVPATSPT